MSKLKKIVEISLAIIYEDENGELIKLDAFEAHDLGIKPEDMQTTTANMVDNLLKNEGFIEVTRKELKK